MKHLINRLAISLLALVSAGAQTPPPPSAPRKLELKLEVGEYWWGGPQRDGRQMPYGAAKFSRNLHGDNGGNQAQPLLISNRGRYVWSGQPSPTLRQRRTHSRIQRRAGRSPGGREHAQGRLLDCQPEVLPAGMEGCPIRSCSPAPSTTPGSS